MQATCYGLLKEPEMIYIAIFILLTIEWFAWVRYKDILNPAVIHNIFWIFSIIGLSILLPDVDISVKTFLLITAGSLSFQIGFSLIRVKGTKNCYFELRTKVIKWSIAILFIPFSYVLFQYYRSGLFLDTTIYESLSEGKEELGIPAYMSYVFKFIQYFTLALLVLYWNSTNKLQKRGTRWWVVFLFLMGLTCTMSTPTRNGLLFFFAPLIVIYLYTHTLSKKKIILFLLASFILFLLYFYLVSLGKYWYKYDNVDSPFSILEQEILIYLSGSIYALDTTIDKHEFTRLGSDTFRYFLAIYDSLFKTNYCPELVNDFIDKKITTNVYTFYDYYIRDFGLLYAIVVQFMYSMIHSYTYKYAKKRVLICMFFSALLTYPLLMQFFQDQYASLISIWLQSCIVALLVFKTKLFFTRNINYI